MGAGKHHGNGANGHRSKHRKDRYAEGLRMRVNALNKLRKQGVLGKGGEAQLEKLERMLDKPRKKALGRGQNRTVTRIPHKLHTYNDHGVRSGKHPIDIQLIQRGEYNKLIVHKVGA